jgi:hypothetical protein
MSDRGLLLRVLLATVLVFVVGAAAATGFGIGGQWSLVNVAREVYQAAAALTWVLIAVFVVRAFVVPARG